MKEIKVLAAQRTPDLVEAGCDEVGRGCLAGPVVAAAVILPKNYSHPLLNDSKQLTAKKREALEKVIKEDALAWAIAEVDHQEIDRINILNASMLAMHKAIDQLELRPELLLIDGNKFSPYMGIMHECIVKGDGKFLSIAAASILAKTYRDQLMEDLAKDYPHYAWEKNAGYPTKVHRAGIKAHGPSPFHRMSFKLLPEE
ncbi:MULTISPECIES: ribonuclease HII [Persicobacter]|uniref:Ribonuclease HII n=1 Tax=Persicobacter diffluens TaxID=981 RepID=A0AAN4VZD7_9BACT|nr:ribonuclease HII [Persicobacter sp. CCB-QB2]GJM61620.1 ribonuclease HII [Persicobacter diffluens]